MDHHEASMPRLMHSYNSLERQQQCRSHTLTTTAAAKYILQKTERRREVRSLSDNNQRPPVVVRRSKSCLFQDKKWKSSSDLESIEVQGFKDLGFVFDKEDLRVRRPYLSETWHQQRSPPPATLIRVQSSSETRSAAEMKDQLRMWAQAVACNVRQEC